MFVGSFLRKKKEIEVQQQEVSVTDLENICGEDKEVCMALWHTMFLDPRKIGATLVEAAKKAAELEKKKDTKMARTWYHIAGGLALWKGDAEKVKKYFGKCAKLAPEMGYETVLKIPEKAVEKAQEYYKKYLK
ncbi:MAG: hypothetical protein NWF11_07495 [Candidatus Bathyarchaeota archaeon]|nr:hypothetical protein [Candidatus Bathyarchaeota archaeon]